MSAETLAEAFHLASIGFRVERHWNIAPGQYVIIIRPETDHRIADRARWGLVPSWSKNPTTGPRPINARAETVAEKPTFREAFRHKRCLIPASGFYEWRKDGSQKQPFYIQPVGEELFAFAGLMENWKGPEGDLQTTCILTTTPNTLTAQIHDRMPVILPETAWEKWLNPSSDPKGLMELLAPFPAEQMDLHPVGVLVGNVGNDGPELIEPNEESQPDHR